MGLPIDRLVIATNQNDILDRTLKSGRYEVTGVHATSSPSMDIQVSSNFERLVFLANSADASAVRANMESLKQANSYTLASPALQAIRAEFDSAMVNEASCHATILSTLKETGELIDPHTAIGVTVAHANPTQSPLVALATAHPAKFPDVTRQVTGIWPDLPPGLKHLLAAKESFTVLPNDAGAVKQFILSRR
jgi:threonine synthase